MDWFCGYNVQTGGSHFAEFQGISQILLYNQRTAAVVEDDDAILHFADGIFVDDTLGGREQWTVQGDDIGGGQQGVQICIFSNAASRIRWMFIISQYLHAKRSGNPSGSLADASKPDDSHGLIFQFNKRIIPETPVRAGIPASCTDRFVVMPDVMADFQK